MAYVKSKKIIVKFPGWVDMIGVMGPVLKPFVCDVNKIMHMVNTKKQVFEILDNGDELELTKRNYELDNNAKKVETKDPKQEQSSTENKEKIENKEDNKEESKESVEEKPTVPTVTEQKDKVYNNQQKNNNNNQQKK